MPKLKPVTPGELLREHGVGPDRAPLVCVHVGSGLNFYDIALKRLFQVVGEKLNGKEAV